MSKSRRERGAAAVEFALIMPLLIVMVLGIVEFGRAYQVQTTLSLAAREGVRAMALKNDATVARATARSAASTVPLTDGQIEILLKADGSTVTSCAVLANATTPTVHVTISYPMTFVTSFFGTSPIYLKGRAAMRCNG